MKAIAGKYKGLLGGKSGSAIMGNQGPLGACGGAWAGLAAGLLAGLLLYMHNCFW